MIIVRQFRFFLLTFVFVVAAFISLTAAEDFNKISGDISLLSFAPTPTVYRAINDIYIPAGKHVQFPAGVVILFERNATFQIRGRCEIKGTENAPVVFSSINDPQYNNLSHSAAPFDWHGIAVTETAESVILQHVTIKYAKFPLVSRAPDLRLTCVQRSQTAMTKFIIHHDSIAVIQDKCYDFPPMRPPVVSAPIVSQPVVPESVPKPVLIDTTIAQKDIPWWKRPNFRWTIGGTGAVALLTGGGCIIGYFVKQADSTEAWNNYAETDNRDFDYRNSEKEKAIETGKTSQNFKQAGIISSAVGVLLLSGFGLTFYF